MFFLCNRIGTKNIRTLINSQEKEHTEKTSTRATQAPNETKDHQSINTAYYNVFILWFVFYIFFILLILTVFETFKLYCLLQYLNMSLATFQMGSIFEYIFCFHKNGFQQLPPNSSCTTVRLRKNKCQLHKHTEKDREKEWCKTFGTFTLKIMKSLRMITKCIYNKRKYLWEALVHRLWMLSSQECMS